MSLTKVSFSMIDGAYINVKDYGALPSNTATQNDTAFNAASAAIVAAGGGTLFVPPGEYEVCHQVFGTGTYAYAQTNAIIITGCTKSVLISGYGAKLKMPDGQHWGSFDPTTGAPYYPASFPFFNPLYAGNPGYFLQVGDNPGGITIEGLELDGNCANYIVGGEFGDIGYQVQADGIYAYNNGFLNIKNVYVHNCGRDGIDLFDGTATTQNSAVRPVYVENVISEYNCRQGLSHQGGLQLTIINSKFSNTGRTTSLVPGTVITFGGVVIPTMASSPAAGIDIEPEAGVICRNITVINSNCSNNFGVGFAADTGNTAHVSVQDSMLRGDTNFPISINAPYTRVSNTTMYGQVKQVRSSTPDPREATVFENCQFADLPAWATVSGYLVELGSKPDAQFINCRFSATYMALADIRDGIIVDCVFLIDNGSLADKAKVMDVRNSYLENNVIVDAVQVPTANGYFVDIDFSQRIVGKNTIIYQGAAGYLKWLTWDATAGGFQGVYGTQQSTTISATKALAIFKNGTNNYVGHIRVYCESAAPISGTYVIGDRVLNSTPAVGQPKGWICTVSGTPGTWVSEGNL
jgi:hypothetical protein